MIWKTDKYSIMQCKFGKKAPAKCVNVNISGSMGFIPIYKNAQKKHVSNLQILSVINHF